MIETQSHELDQLSKEELITLLQQEQAKTAQLATEAANFNPLRKWLMNETTHQRGYILAVKSQNNVMGLIWLEKDQNSQSNLDSHNSQIWFKSFEWGSEDITATEAFAGVDSDDMYVAEDFNQVSSDNWECL